MSRFFKESVMCFGDKSLELTDDAGSFIGGRVCLDPGTADGKAS
jgi:hypothetical protein